MDTDTIETRRTAARHYLATVPMLEGMISDCIARAAHMSEQKKSQLARTLRERGGHVEAALVEVFVRHHSTAELEAMARFYASPEGRLVMKNAPAVMADIVSDVSPRLQALLDELLRP